jgi:hypothetical protein
MPLDSLGPGKRLTSAEVISTYLEVVLEDGDAPRSQGTR